jgi:hypothetical protein
MHKTITKLAAEIGAAVEGATERELCCCPAEGKWCAAQVLEHLQRTYTGTMKGLERVLSQGKPLTTPVPPKKRVMQFLVITANWFPEGRKSPKVAEPKGDVVVMDMPRTIQEKLAEMDGLLNRCQEKFGSSKVLDHPILGALTVDQWRKFHLVHGRHHVKQVRERRALAG